MDVGVVLIELKANTLKNIDAWKDELNVRKEEAIETLVAEGVQIESWFYLEVEEKHYLIAYMRAKNIALAQQIGRNSHFPIDKIHKAFKQNWQKVMPAQLLVDLENSRFDE